MEQHIQYLLDKYNQATSTEAEEEELKEYFRTADVPAEWVGYKAQFQFFDNKKAENSAADFDPLAKIRAEKSHIISFSIKAEQLRWVYQIAAGIVLVLLGYGAGHFAKSSKNNNGEELAALRSDVIEMKKILLSGDRPTGSSASLRLQAVNQSANIENADSEVIELLISTMDRDPNVNVRLAAAEALFKFGNVARVRAAFVNSLKLQKDPVLQIALIDMLVALKEKSALTEMQNLAQDKNAMKIVKQKAQAGIGVLL